MLSEIERENYAALSCETHRYPDRNTWLIDYVNKLLLTPEGHVIQNYILQDTLTQQKEYSAYQALQIWATDLNTSGYAIWFSPPFEKTDKFNGAVTSKITISLKEKGNGELVNRGIVLDINGQQLLHFANGLSETTFSNPEDLREIIMFPTEKEFSGWFDQLGKFTNQVAMIKNGFDIIAKKEALAKIDEIALSIPIYQHLEAALRRDLIGQYRDSCGTIGSEPKFQSAFEMVFNSSKSTDNEETLDCTCPFCEKSVKAVIKDGKIHCPNCDKSAPYKC
jgi:hypothetical protein